MTSSVTCMRNTGLRGLAQRATIVLYAYFAHRFCADVSTSDISCARDVFMPITLNLGKAFLLGLAIRHEESGKYHFIFILAQNQLRAMYRVILDLLPRRHTVDFHSEYSRCRCA